MYYSFKCTYCGRVFYTYETNKENASIILYRAVKQHLIDYNEDHREYEMDDGEQTDSEQIFVEMHESKHPPTGGYEATRNSIVTPSHSTPTSTSSTNTTLIVIFLLILGFICVFIFVPEFQIFVKQFLP